MRRRGVVLALAVALVLGVLTGLAAAAPGGGNGKASSGGSDYVMVLLASPPAASYQGSLPGLARTKPVRGKLDQASPAYVAYRRHLDNEHASYRSYLTSSAPKAEIVAEYHDVLNGFALRLNGTKQADIARGPGVRVVGNSWLYRPTMNTSVDVIRATDLWAATAGREDAGSGVKVGIVDSGIDDSHVFFECKGEIVHKVYASGVALGAVNPTPTLFFDHGTHVAGTVGGCVTTAPVVGTISGVAPAAELWDYNVFPGFGAGFWAFGGSAFSHDIARALEDTVADGMDVVNMSLGGGVQGPHDFLAEAVNGTFDAGVVVAVAAGNSGPGDSTVESPGSAANALTVGATTNSHVIGVPVDVTDAGGTVTYLGAAGDFDPFAATMATGESLVDWADTGGAINGCAAAPSPAPVAGKIALISRGACTFTTKVRNAENAGAFGVIVYNNQPGPPVAMGHDGTDPFPAIPALMVSDVDGAAILGSLPATAIIDGSSPTEFSTTPDIIAGFSSRGPSPFNHLIKPDVTAPGVNVYSSVFDNEFALNQGTSMATPHVAGSAALVIEQHPGWSAADVKSALVNTAARVVTTDGATPAGVLARGNGRLDVFAADATPVTIDPVSASFGARNGNKPVSGSVELTLSNVSDGAITCSVGLTGPSIVTASAASVSLSAGASDTLTLTLDAGRSDTTPSGDYDGDVELGCGGTDLLVPWWVRVDRQAKP